MVFLTTPNETDYFNANESLSYHCPFPNQPRLELARSELVAAMLITRHCSFSISD
jgi:hypothetical protein